MPSAPAHIRCILFDLGSTLWDHIDDDAVWEAAYSAAEERARVTLAAVLPPSESASLDATWAKALHTRVEERIAASHHTDLDEEPTFGEVTMLALRDMGITEADGALGAAVFEALRVRSLGTRVPFPDALATLATLRERGYTLGVVTNRHYGGEIFLDDLRQMGLLPYFDPRFLAISADLGWRKPHPNIFRHALNGLGMTPAEAAMVGDHLLADIWGGQRLGLFTIWKPKRHLIDAARALTGDTAPDLAPATQEALFIAARQHVAQHDPRIAHVEMPAAIITAIGELTALFPPRS